MKQVEEEYYKTDGDQAHAPTSKNTIAPGSSTELYPPSPDQPFHTMEQNIPDPVKEAVKSLIKSQKTVEPYTQATQSSDPVQQVTEENVIVIPSREIPLFKDTMDSL